MDLTGALKGAIRSISHRVSGILDWADDVDDEDEDALLQRDAAYLTTGLITAARSLNEAHDEGEDCSSHHTALNDLLVEGISDPLIALHALRHLTEIIAHRVDDEDVQNLVRSIVAIELSMNDPDHLDDEDDHR